MTRLLAVAALLAVVVVLPGATTAEARGAQDEDRVARVDAALRALPAASPSVRPLRRQAKVQAAAQPSTPACPDAAGVVRGTERWTRTLAVRSGRDADTARVQASLAWEGAVGDDARLKAWRHGLTVVVTRSGRARGKAVPARRFRMQLRSGELAPGAPKPAAGGAWTGRGQSAKGVKRALATIGAAARQDLERAASTVLQTAERRWYDDQACVRLSAAPGGARMVVGGTLAVLVSAQSATGGPVAGAVAITDVARGRVAPASGALPPGAPFQTTFTAADAGAGGLTATLTSRQGRARARWDVTIDRAAEQAPPEPEGFPGFTQVALSGVELDGTVWHFHEELPGPDDTVTTKWQSSGTMSYRSAPKDPNDTSDDFTKWWDWDLADHLADHQVGTLKPVAYEASATGRVDQWVEDDHAVWDCSYTLPDAAKPPGLVGILSRTAEGYEVYWTLLPAYAKCPPSAPYLGFEPLPAKTLTTRFRGGDVFTGESHVSRIPIDIDESWSDSAGSHRITWKGAVYVSEPQI